MKNTIYRWIAPVFFVGGLFSCQTVPTEIYVDPTVSAQDLNNPKKLPPCPRDQNARTHNCWGTFSFQAAGQWKGDKYIGEFNEGKFHGQGTYYHLADNQSKGNKYVGEYKDDKRNGQGTHTWANGDKYVGQYRDGMRNGQGTFTKPNGDKYVGEFKEGRFHGQGIYTKVDGTRFEGIWANDNFIGKSEINLKNTNNNNAEPNANNSDLIREISARVTVYISEAQRLTQEEKYRDACDILDTTVKMINEYKLINIIDPEKIRKQKDDTCLLSEQKRERILKELKEQSNSASETMNPFFMDQLIKGGGSTCFEVRQTCKQSGNYDQCIHYFNLNKSGQGGLVGPACNP
jgi:hypothetical protein